MSNAFDRTIKRVCMMTVVIISIFTSSVLWGAEQQADASTPLQGLDRVEKLLYGEPGSGGLLLRLSKVERDLFGMDLPGSLTERQQALQVFVEDGTASQPSLLFKMGVAEWITLRKTHPSMPFADRVAQLENTLEGEEQIGALSARLERIITKLVPGGVLATQVDMAASTVFRAKFVETVTVRNVAVGDVIALEIDEDCIIAGTLAVAKGNRLMAQVTKVKLPRSFGRPSEIQFDFKNIETIGAKEIPVIVGPEAEKAMDVDSGMIGAAGASLAGAIALGPLGLAGGFLVRGNDKQIPEGTQVYVETEEAARIDGYAVPNIMDMMQGAGASSSSSQQGGGDIQDTSGGSDSDTVVY